MKRDKELLEIIEAVCTIYDNGPVSRSKYLSKKNKDVYFLDDRLLPDDRFKVAKHLVYIFNKLNVEAIIARPSAGEQLDSDKLSVQLDTFINSTSGFKVRFDGAQLGTVTNAREIIGELIGLYVRSGIRTGSHYVYFRYEIFNKSKYNHFSKVAIKTRSKNSILSPIYKRLRVRNYDEVHQPNGVWFDDLKSLQNLVKSGLIDLDEVIKLLDKVWNL